MKNQSILSNYQAESLLCQLFFMLRGYQEDMSLNKASSLMRDYLSESVGSSICLTEKELFIVRQFETFSSGFSSISLTAKEKEVLNWLFAALFIEVERNNLILVESLLSRILGVGRIVTLSGANSHHGFDEPVFILDSDMNVTYSLSGALHTAFSQISEKEKG